jgi:hypothetical protein
LQGGAFVQISKSLTLLALGIALPLALRAVPPLQPAPEILAADAEEPSAPPLWVSAQAAADPGTVLDWDLLGRDGALLRDAVERQRKHLERTKALGAQAPELSLRQIQAADCFTTFSRTGVDGGIDRLEDLVEHSRAIFRGVVRSVALGFGRGVPSSLLTVDVEEVLRDSIPLGKSRIYVDYPVARFAIGPYHFCNDQQGFAPKAGDRILVFVRFGPIGRHRVLLNPTLDRIFFESAEAGLYLPGRLPEDPLLADKSHLEEVAALVRDRLQQSSGR